MLLYGLHVNFNFDKIRFINDGFITKTNFGTNNLGKCFGRLRSNYGSDPIIIVCGKNVLTFSICDRFDEKIQGEPVDRKTPATVHGVALY